MTASVAARPAVTVRPAGPLDNGALVALASACPMDGEIGLCLDRAPDFFALNRLEGSRWTVAVAEHERDGVVGCIAVAERSAYLHGRPDRVCYVSDLKVHPAHRRGTVADALTAYASDECRRIGGGRQPVFLSILAGNARMERRATGPRGLPSFRRFAVVRTYSIPLLVPRRHDRHFGLRIRPAQAGDLEEMAALWNRVAPGRQLAAVHDGQSIAHWVSTAPGLALSDFLLARRVDGRLAGYLGVWDQRSLKQLRVTRYSPRLRLVRAAINAAAPLVGAPRLPAEGQPLRLATATHVCIADADAAVLRALLSHACARLRPAGYALLNVGLDPADPLAAGVRGLWPQVTDAHAYVATPDGPYAGLPLADRPLHFETALV